MEFCAVFALRYFDEHLQAAAVLVFFLPLIIASGGNSGSQAATLVVRAMALDEVRLRDWWRVARREVAMGLMLGTSLGLLGASTVIAMHFVTAEGLGEHYLLVGLTVGLSVICVALWGTLVGSMLPFGLRRLGLDPASASAPLLATIVDATGLLIYFSVAGVLLRGTLL
jgi:magnesium transporter